MSAVQSSRLTQNNTCLYPIKNVKTAKESAHNEAQDALELFLTASTQPSTVKTQLNIPHIIHIKYLH
jgi:hypothetical protein